jgi:hypothetical protein
VNYSPKYKMTNTRLEDSPIWATSGIQIRNKYYITVNDIYRTGAKCVSEGIQDPLGAGDNYHITGAFR